MGTGKILRDNARDDGGKSLSTHVGTTAASEFTQVDVSAPYHHSSSLTLTSTHASCSHAHLCDSGTEHSTALDES